MDKIIFYIIVGIIIPSIFTLFNIGNVMFTIGEFKEHKIKIPKLLYILFVKSFILSIIIFHTFHYYTHSFIPENFYYISIVLNFYVVLEYLQINKSFTKIREFLHPDIIDFPQPRIKINTFIKEGFTILLKENLLFYCFTQIIGFILIGLISIMVHEYFSLFNLYLVILLVGVYSVKFYFAKYLSTL